LELVGYDFPDPSDGPWKSILFFKCLLVDNKFYVPALDHKRNSMPGLQCRLRMVAETFK
jgi:hypothetical protein